MKNYLKKTLGLTTLFALASKVSVYAESLVNLNVNGSSSDTIEILIMLTVLSLAPSIIIMMSSFTRIIMVLSFLKSALGLQQTPPNQVLIGIALFLTLFTMQPVISEINTTAYEPYKAEEITQEEFFDRASEPIKEFMLKNTGKSELKTFVDISTSRGGEEIKSVEDLSLTVIIPAFITSELKRAFTIGFLLYIPFLIIDMIVSSVLMSMGMMMLPPVMISMPFKILLFVVVDGWGLLFKTLITSFNF